MLSHKSKYALKAAIALAREFGQGPVLISDIAQRERIPRKFLELILLEFRHTGILQSRKEWRLLPGARTRQCYSR
jgi:DNA-binding IscR family transcriptional regulator